MDLILWRHADAGTNPTNQGDLGRPLSKKGIKQAKKMAKWLDKELPKDTRIIVSPAVRTEETVKPLEALGRKYEVLEALEPTKNVAALLKAANWPDSKVPVLVVGHQPTLGKVVAQLVVKKNIELHVKKGAIWWITDEDTSGKTTLRTVVGPKDI